MKRYLGITLSALVVAALAYFLTYTIFNDTRLAVGSLTFSGWLSLILFSAYNAKELERGRH